MHANARACNSRTILKIAELPRRLFLFVIPRPLRRAQLAGTSRINKRLSRDNSRLFAPFANFAEHFIHALLFSLLALIIIITPIARGIAEDECNQISI